MNELNQRLQRIFLFGPAEVRANRGGQFTPRQQARQRGGGITSWLAMSVFAVVMACSVGIVALIAWQTGMLSGTSRGDTLTSLFVIGAVMVAAVVIGFALSWPYMRSMFTKQITVAQGTAQLGKVREDAAHFEVKIGTAKLRLLTEEQQVAFEPGVEYRVQYLAGPAPVILSAEVVGTEQEADANVGLAETPVEQDEVVVRQRRAVPVLLVLGLLAIGIPLIALVTPSLPEGLRVLLLGGLCAAGVAFAVGAIWYLTRPTPGSRS